MRVSNFQKSFVDEPHKNDSFKLPHFTFTITKCDFLGFHSKNGKILSITISSITSINFY